MPATSASAAAAAGIKFRVALEESLHYNLQCCLLLLQHVEMSQAREMPVTTLSQKKSHL